MPCTTIEIRDPVICNPINELDPSFQESLGTHSLTQSSSEAQLLGQVAAQLLGQLAAGLCQEYPTIRQDTLTVFQLGDF